MLAMGIILSGAYSIEIIKGLKTVQFFIVMELICWIPFIIGLIYLKIKGWHADKYYDIVGIGYGLFYLYIMLTSPGTLAFTYILPLVSMLIIYKNRNFILRCGVVVESMEELVVKSNTLGEKINSSMEMTEDIDNQVANVTELVNHIVELSEKSTQHANSSCIKCFY